MSGAIGPGDWIECVGPFNDASALAALRAGGCRFDGNFQVGTLTICEAVTPTMRMPDGRLLPGLKTRDVKAFKDGREVWLAAYQWRPIYRPKADLIESLKAPPISAPVRQSEAA